jgi:CHAT domain-containing protein/Tfp pilus assembly protein PilF
MLTRRFFLLLLILSLSSVFAQAQVTPGRTTLVPGQTVEREVAGGESHAYQINLAAGQFVRFVLEQQAIDLTLTLTDADGKSIAEVNLTAAGAFESLSAEASVSGDYRLGVRAGGGAMLRGAYRLRTKVKAGTAAQDKQRIAAERLIIEANELNAQGGGKAAEPMLAKLPQAVALFDALGDQYWSAWSLRAIGWAYFKMSTYEKAIEYYQQALVIQREVKDLGGEGWTLNSLGPAYVALGRYEKAIEYYERALVIQREIKDLGSEGYTLLRLGVAYRLLGRYEKATEYREQALAIFREVKNRAGEASSLLGLGIDYINLGRYEKAIEYYKQALAIQREVKDRGGEGWTLNELGIAYTSLGQYEKAIEYNEQALAIQREIKNRDGEGSPLLGLGTAYINLGRHERAIEYYEQALGIQREVKNRFGEASSLLGLGTAYIYLGRYEKAIEYNERALAIQREIKDLGGEGRTLNNLGIAYSSLGRYEKAIEYYERALAIDREVKSRASEGIALMNLGFAYYGLGRNEKAIEYYEQALAIAREVKGRRNEGVTLSNLGDAYRSLGRLDEAVRHHEQALLVAREVKAPADEAEALHQLAADERNRGNLVRARALIEESLGIAESVRIGVVSQESRAGFLATVQSAYQLYTDLLMGQHKADPTKGLDALAVEVSERQRGRSVLDLLIESRADVRQGVDATLIERERTLAKQLNDKALTTAGTPEAVAALKQEISQLETDYERAQAAIRKASPHYAALTQPRPLKLKEIQQQLDADTLLLEYALGEERSYLWAISKDSLTSYELPKEELIKQSALQVYELLTAHGASKRGESASQRRQRITDAETRLPAAAQQLSQILLAPAAVQLGNKRLVIVADGPLQYIPFAMLPEPEFRVSSSESRVQDPKRQNLNSKPETRNSKPLILNHEVVSLPSASVLAIQRKELAGRQPATKMLAVIADPVFDRTDERFKSLAPEANDKAQTQTVAFNDARSIEHLADKSDDKAGMTTRRLVIPRLPFTRQEATRLLALTPKISSFGAVDFQANRATVLNGELGKYRYVHFATHGLLDSERPGLSSLVLSMVDVQGKQQDGFLRANDIYNLKLPAELVVLSACQTGLGKEIKGEGLVGLTRGFMYAGAARVVVSLWNVNDRATADLMAKFYEKMLKQGERPAAALRAAQVEMWKQKQWQSPYYWAAFTMQGEWR